jgi:hypothetical protein
MTAPGSQCRADSLFGNAQRDLGREEVGEMALTVSGQSIDGVAVAAGRGWAACTWEKKAGLIRSV